MKYNTLSKNQANAATFAMDYDEDFAKAYATAISGTELRKRLRNRMMQWQWNEK